MPATLRAFLKGQYVCGNGLHWPTIMGNGFVVNDWGITLECLDCRTDWEVSVDYDTALANILNVNGPDREKLLIHMARYAREEETHWMQLLMALRTNHSKLWGNDWSRHKRGFRVDIYPSVHGNPDAIACGECHLGGGTPPKGGGRFTEEDVCWNCGLPDEYQWNMRESFDNEVRLIGHAALSNLG